MASLEQIIVVEKYIKKFGQPPECLINTARQIDLSHRPFSQILIEHIDGKWVYYVVNPKMGI